MATAKPRSVNDALGIGAREGSHREISKDWGNIGKNNVSPCNPAYDFCDGYEGVVKCCSGCKAPRDCDCGCPCCSGSELDHAF
jgi:hypothetical protein